MTGRSRGTWNHQTLAFRLNNVIINDDIWSPDHDGRVSPAKYGGKIDAIVQCVTWGHIVYAQTM